MQQGQLPSPGANPFQQQQQQNPFQNQESLMFNQQQGNNNIQRQGSSHSTQNMHQQPQQVKRKNSTQNAAQLDYLIKPHKKAAERRHADPSVSFSVLLENILNSCENCPNRNSFCIPSTQKKSPTTTM
jgi:hypothetical protein